MKSFSLLLKKQLKEQFIFTKKDKKNADIFGVIFTFALIAIVLAVVVFVVNKVTSMYVEIRVDRVINIQNRAYELFVMTFAILLVVNIFSGIKNINFTLFQSDDLKILIYMPIKPSVLFSSKMVSSYIKQFATAFLTIIPINITIGLAIGAGAYFYGMTVLMIFVVPLISLSLGSVFALPIYYAKKLFESKYILLLLVVTAILGILFWGYSTILMFVKNLLTTGNMRFFFNADVMSNIGEITANLYPANTFANILLGRNLVFSFLILIATAVGSCAFGLILSRYLLIPAAQGRMGGNNRKVYSSRRVSKFSNVTWCLMRNEFLHVLRTPSYAFQYFSTALIMPIMVYFCISIFSPLVRTMIFVNCDLELCIFLVVMFGVLTNTFCATNISRDGEIFFAVKTMPIGHRRIVRAKVMFCFIVSAISIAISCIVVTALGYLSVAECFFVLAVTLLLSFSQICFATRKDFNHPHFSKEDDGEIKESNSTVSVLVMLGLIVSFAIGAITLYCGLVLKISKGVEYGEMMSMLIVSATSIVIATLAIAYLFVGLDKKYYQLSEGNV